MNQNLVTTIHHKFRLLAPAMNERMVRLWSASEAKLLGHGGISVVARATGLAHTTIRRGLRELAEPARRPGPTLAPARSRRPGGGRKRLQERDPELLAALEALIDPATRGHPESPLRWTCKSTRRLAEELTRAAHPVSPRKVAELLAKAGYSLQANRKTREGLAHPDRNAQFEYINEQVKGFGRAGRPVHDSRPSRPRLDYARDDRMVPRHSPNPMRATPSFSQ